MRLFACAVGLVMAMTLAQSVPAEDLQQRLAAASVKRGQMLFMVCKACHDLEPGQQPPKAGPALNGIFGRKAGTEPGFKYTDAMVRSGIVWTPETMDTFLKQPGALVPGTGMAFPGLPGDADRASLIAYLMSVTAAQ